MKKILVIAGILITSVVLNASEPKVGYIIQNETQKKLASSWNNELSLDDGNLAFQIMDEVNDPELILTIPQNNESVWINPYMNKHQKIMDNSLIVKSRDGKYRLLVGLFWKGSKESKKMYKSLVDVFGKKNIKIINDLTRFKPFSKDIYEIFKPKNSIKKEKYWGMAG